MHRDDLQSRIEATRAAEERKMLDAPPASRSFARLAYDINLCLKHADESRIEAGRLLCVARSRIEADEVIDPDTGKPMLWTKWCQQNINRSLRDIQKVMALVRAPDPRAALEAERRAARAGMQTRRAAQSEEASNVRRGPPSAAPGTEGFSDLVATVEALDPDTLARFLSWIKDRYPDCANVIRLSEHRLRA